MKSPRCVRALAATVAIATALLAGPAASAQEAADVLQASLQQACHSCDSTCCEPSCGCNDNGCNSCGDSCCNNCCRKCCRKCCVSKVEVEKVEKHCWKVECKDVCVPKVVLPWQDGGSGITLFSFLDKHKCGGNCGDACCTDACCSNACGDGCCSNGACCLKPRCGKVKCVRDIKKEKYECEKCVCKWEIRRLPPCCDDGCGGECCGDADCGATCCPDSCTALPATAEIQLTSATNGAANATATAPMEPPSVTPSETEQAAKPSWLESLRFWK